MKTVALCTTVVLCTILLCQNVYGQTAAPAPKQLLLPPPPPPPPNNPPRFRDGADQITQPPVDLQEPIQELIDTGGVALIVDIEFTAFQSEKETKLKTTMSEASNRYCVTKGNCEGAHKDTDKDDVIVYDIKASSKPKRTVVSFYIKNPYSRTQLTMTSDQLQMMFKAERKSIETSLGDRLDLGDLEFEPFTNGLLLESWLIALLCVISLAIVVGIFVAFINYRNKKTDTKLTFEDIEMRHQESELKKCLPSGPVVPASSLKKAKIDASTNVYQDEILSETKSVFIKPSTVKRRVETDTVLYAVVHKEAKQYDGLQESSEKLASPNSIVVTADVSSSNEGSSHFAEDLPPAYEQATKEETQVIEGSGGELAGPSGEVSCEVTLAPGEELPPPPPTVEDTQSLSSASVDLPPPPTLPPPPPPPPSLPPQDDQSSGSSSRKESATSSGPSEKSSTKDAPVGAPPRKDSRASGKEAATSAEDASSASPLRKDSRASSTNSSAKASSSGQKAEEVVGELENLIADQSKEITEKGAGQDNAGFETTLNEKGELMTEL